MTEVDAIVVGQGFAGTAVAWALRWQGWRVLVVDRGTTHTASRTAAGLITPITGRRLALSWRFHEFWPTAMAFYRRVEAELGIRCLDVAPAVRLFIDTTELSAFNHRATFFYPDLVSLPEPAIDGQQIDAPFGAFQMSPAARLDPSAYLNASRDHFQQNDGLITASLDLERDVAITDQGVRLILHGVRSRWMVLCQGYEAVTHSWGQVIPLNPVKGEILTLRIPGLHEQRVVHRGIWLAPQIGDLYLAGSTFDRLRNDCIPTDEGRREILSRLRTFLRLPVVVCGHRAAVRPTVLNNRPVFGVHPEFSGIAWLNGLGSKGALLAPHFARALSTRLTGRMQQTSDD